MKGGEPFFGGSVSVFAFCLKVKTNEQGNKWQRALGSSWTGDKTTNLSGFTKQTFKANWTWGTWGVPERRFPSLGQPLPLAILNLKNTSKDFFFHVDSYLVWAVRQDEKWLVRAGEGIQEVSGCTLILPLSLNCMPHASWMPSFRAMEIKKNSFPRNFRVKNELTALMLVSLLTQTFNGGKRRWRRAGSSHGPGERECVFERSETCVLYPEHITLRCGVSIFHSWNKSIRDQEMTFPQFLQ